MALKNTWQWWPLALIAMVCSVVLYGASVDRDSIGFTVVMIVAFAYAALIQLRFRVTLTGEGMAMRAFRRSFVPRSEIVAIEVGRSYGGRRLTVVRTDGTAVRLPVSWSRDPRWNETRVVGRLPAR